MIRANGFTLVEMLVALAIFGLLSAGGIAVLRASLTTQDAVAGRLEADRSAQRVVALFQADVSQAIARPLTGVGDARLPSLEGDSASLSLVRDGWANPGDHPRSSLQRVRWSGRDGAVVRTAHLYLDGFDPGEPAAFASGVRGVRFRYRFADGTWNPSFRPTDRQLLPTAVEMSLDSKGSTLTMVVALPPRGPEPLAEYVP